MAKVFSILTLLVALGATFLGFQSKELVGKLQVAAERDHKDLLDTRATLKKTEATLKTTEEELKTTKEELSKTQIELTAAKTELDKTKTELEATKTDLADKNTQLAALKKQLEDALGGTKPEDLKKEIANMLAAKMELEAKVQTLEKEKAELTTTVETLTANKKEAEERIASQGKVIDRYQKNIMQKGVRGRVLAVNAGWGFCVLSIGDRQGAAANKIMIVARDGQSIGKVKIINVEASQSVADIIPSSFVRGAYVQPGDDVIFTGEDKVREEPAEAAKTPSGPALPTLPALPQP
jgi:myosin heavy subunit